MTALKVIGIILLIMLLIASVRVRALARFGEKTELTLFVGPFRMTLLPEMPGLEADGQLRMTEDGTILDPSAMTEKEGSVPENGEH